MALECGEPVFILIQFQFLCDGDLKSGLLIEFFRDLGRKLLIILIGLFQRSCTKRHSVIVFGVDQHLRGIGCRVLKDHRGILCTSFHDLLQGFLSDIHILRSETVDKGFDLFLFLSVEMSNHIIRRSLLKLLFVIKTVQEFFHPVLFLNGIRQV